MNNCDKKSHKNNVFPRENVNYRTFYPHLLDILPPFCPPNARFKPFFVLFRPFCGILHCLPRFLIFCCRFEPYKRISDCLRRFCRYLRLFALATAFPLRTERFARFGKYFIFPRCFRILFSFSAMFRGRFQNVFLIFGSFIVLCLFLLCLGLAFSSFVICGSPCGFSPTNCRVLRPIADFAVALRLLSLFLSLSRLFFSHFICCARFRTVLPRLLFVLRLSCPFLRYRRFLIFPTGFSRVFPSLRLFALLLPSDRLFDRSVLKILCFGLIISL